MTESSSRTLVCSVLFLDIAEYSKKTVADQLQLKQAFNQVLAQALEQVPPRDRVILDTGDGAAVTFVGDPEDCLFAAMSVRDLAGAVPIRLGVNLGPVRVVKDINGQINIIGDGINVAQRIMSFSSPGQLLVSRSFYEVVSCLSRDYAKLFRHEGSRTDKHVREHEVYSVVGGIAPERRVAETAQLRAGEGAAAWFAGPGLLGFRRSALLVAPLAFLVLAASGLAARVALRPAVSESAFEQPPSPRAQRLSAAMAVAEPREAEEPAEARRPARPLPVRPGRVELAVVPWGEVLVDGERRGVTPPLRRLELPPGPHTIEIRNSTFPARIDKIDIKSGQAVRIQQRFR